MDPQCISMIFKRYCIIICWKGNDKWISALVYKKKDLKGMLCIFVNPLLLWNPKIKFSAWKESMYDSSLNEYCGSFTFIFIFRRHTWTSRAHNLAFLLMTPFLSYFYFSKRNSVHLCTSKMWIAWIYCMSHAVQFTQLFLSLLVSFNYKGQIHHYHPRLTNC